MLAIGNHHLEKWKWLGVKMRGRIRVRRCACIGAGSRIATARRSEITGDPGHEIGDGRIVA
ncbi:hypothetical protein, partial [Burkholderia gladioli]|uniref:hypothetical protein n=1 Tax=Burkholderia gladioli TaxID=28095 RepID=UPI001ABB26E3